MTKVVLNSVTGNQAITHNANSEAIEAAIENTLSRDGTTPNQMGADLDMNGHSILNLGSPIIKTVVESGVTSGLSVPSFTELDALTDQSYNDTVFVEKRTNSGGGGIFMWKQGDYSSEIASDPQGGIYRVGSGVSATTAAWVRMVSSSKEYTPEMWGAVVDSTSSATSNVTAIQAGVDWIEANSGGTLTFNVGTYWVDPGSAVKCIALKPKVNLIGQGSDRTIIKKTSGSLGTHILEASNDTVLNITIKGITLDGNSGTSGHGVRAVGCSYLTAEDLIVCHNGGYGIGLQPSTNNQTSRMIFKDMICHNNGLDGFDVKDSFQCTYENIICHNNANRGFDVRGREVSYNNITAYNNTATGISLRAWGATTGYNDCIINANNLISYNNGSSGIILLANEDASWTTQVFFNLTNVDSRENSTAAGIYVDSDNPNYRAKINLTNVNVQDNDDGIQFNGHSDILLTNCRSYNNTRYGIRVVAGSNCRIIGGRFTHSALNILCYDRVFISGALISNARTDNLVFQTGSDFSEVIDCFFDAGGTTSNIAIASGINDVVIRGGRMVNKGLYNITTRGQRTIIDSVRFRQDSSDGATASSKSVRITSGATNCYLLDNYYNEVTVGDNLQNFEAATTTERLL